MKVKWTGLVDDLRGHVDSRHYARHIPGNGSEAAARVLAIILRRVRRYYMIRNGGRFGRQSMTRHYIGRENGVSRLTDVCATM